MTRSSTSAAFHQPAACKSKRRVGCTPGCSIHASAVSHSFSSPSSWSLQHSVQHAWTRSELKQKLQPVVLHALWCELLLKAASSAVEQPLLNGAGYVSGQASLSTAFNGMVGPFASYDIKYGESCSLRTGAGLVGAMTFMLRIARSGYTHFGTLCRSWMVLSRSFKHRPSTLFAGPPRSPCTEKQWHYLQAHNRLGELSVYLIKLARAMGRRFTLEQPISSLRIDFAPMSLAVASAPMMAFSMGAF